MVLIPQATDSPLAVLARKHHEHPGASSCNYRRPWVGPMSGPPCTMVISAVSLQSLYQVVGPHLSGLPPPLTDVTCVWERTGYSPITSA